MLSTIAQCILIAALPSAFQEQKQQEGPLPRQPGDDVAKPLKKPLPEKAKQRLEAESWFMTGRLEEREGRFESAIKAYKKALEYDESSSIYRELIPLCFRLNRVPEGTKYARRAVELDPNDYEILQQLSLLSMGANRVPDAIEYIEKALESDRLEEFSPANVILHRDLVRLCGATRKLKRAAEGCDVLFAAMKDPEKYGLNAAAQRELAQQTDLIGNVFAAAGKRDRAIEVFEEQARVRGNRPGSHNLSLANLYLQSRDYERAEKQIVRFLSTKPKRLEPYQMYAQILTSSDRKDQLIPKFEELQKEQKRNSTLAFFLGQLYIQADRLDDAEATITAAIRRSGNPVGYLSLAEIYRQQKNAEKLLDSLIKAGDADVTLPPQFAQSIGRDTELAEQILTAGKRRAKQSADSIGYQGNYMLGQIASSLEKTDDAVRFYRAALQMGRADQIPLVSMELGTALLFDDKYAEAAEVLENALKQPANNEQLRRQQVLLLYRLAQAREFGDETDKAIKALKRAQSMPEAQPMQATLHYQEGWTYYHAQQIDKAEEKLQSVVERFSRDQNTYKRARMLLASVHSQQRNFEIAIEEFEAIIRDYGNEADTVRSARMSLSGLYISKGDQPKAEAILEEVLKDDPDDPGVNNDLGYLYADQNKNLAQAEAMIRKAVKSSPENAAYLDSLGWVLFRRAKYQEAIDWLEKAIKLPDGEDSTIVEHLGDNYEKLGKADEAMKNWKRALDIETSSPYPDESVVERLEKKVETGKSEPGK